MSSTAESASVAGQGLWTEDEKAQYNMFVKENPGLFTDAVSKGKKAFKLMAELIPTRSAKQCRSHHQKLMMKAARHARHRQKEIKISPGASTNPMIDFGSNTQKSEPPKLHPTTVEVATDDSKQDPCDEVLWFEVSDFVAEQASAQEELWDEWALRYPFDG